MGITIGYRGQLKSPELIDKICRELKEIANLMEKEKMEFLSKKLDAFAQTLDNSWIEIEPGDSDLDILVKIEKILREMEE